MNNILTHARASTVSVVLDLSSPDRLRLRIDDDGVGLPPAQDLVPGNGLQGMRERALALGGTLTVTPGPQGGTRVEADLPLQG
ncbi:MAG: sensor histidine kinase [Rubrivivax sp.]